MNLLVTPSFFFRVEILYLGGNQIGNIPDSIGCLRSLIVLNLSDNRLRTLPSSISRKIDRRVNRTA